MPISQTRPSWNFGTYDSTTLNKVSSCSQWQALAQTPGEQYLESSCRLPQRLTYCRFHDIAWAPPSADHPRGIIAGALENGSLDLWDAAKLINGAEDAFMSRTTKHTGAIKSLQFNPMKPQILATAGAKGELFIYDVQDVSNPFRLGTAAARSDDLECIAWNRKVPNILATGGSGGFVTVWDLKTKKASLTLNNNRKAVGAIAWDPNNATKLLTATPDDSAAVILLWDLRNSNAPERMLQGHDQGILSISWCQQDCDLLLSCGKDNRTLLWNPQTGERLGEFPEVTNWTFQTRFHPHNPALSATASFDGKISVQTLQNTNPTSTQAPVHSSTDGEDFFTKAQTQPQGASFTLQKAPKWLERPTGASFGFGGKLVSFQLQPVTSGQARNSKIQITSFSVDSDVAPATESFEKALLAGDMAAICASHIAQAKGDDDGADWKIIETLLDENPRKKVTEYLGFQDQEEKLNGDGKTDESTIDPTSDLSKEAILASKTNNRLSTLFSDGVEGDDFLSSITATKGAKTDNPFHLISEQESVSGRQVTRALVLGQFETAMTICIKEGRIADALIIANCGGKELFDTAQSAYLAQKAQGASYLRLLSSVIGKNLWDVVYNADLSNWKETMATLCTYAEPNEFPDLCEALGDRLLETGVSRDACFCYLVGSKLEKVVSIWLGELQQGEKKGLQKQDADSSFSIHARSLQSFIEKVTVFREVTKFQDTEKTVESDWKLGSLYEKYAEYADIVAAHGQLSIAERYLDLLPSKYPAAEVARNRVKLASRKAEPRGVQSTTKPRVQPQAGYQPSQPASIISPQTPANHYAPAASASASNPYAPSHTPSNNPYAPQQGYQQQGQAPFNPGVSTGYSNLNSGYGAPQTSFAAPPPSAIASTPSAPPPPKAKDMSNWNDTPMVTKPPTARRSTPVQANTQYSAPQNLSMPPSAPPYGVVKSSPPPPPRGPAPPRMSSPLAAPNAGQFSGQSRPSSSTNALAPPPKSGGAQHYGQPGPALIPRGPSPYNPPPPTAPPSNRYAPSPAQQANFAQQPGQQPGQHAPPPQQAPRPPPPNPYAPQPGAGPQTPYAQPQQAQQHGQFTQAPYQNQGPPPSQGPPMSQGPPPTSRPPTTGPPSRGSPAPVPSSKAKYPPGDRSHIPAHAQRVVDVLEANMQRITAKAPQSYAPQVKDTQKRLNILFDHLNNEELVMPNTIQQLGDLVEALSSKNFDAAARIQVDIQSQRTQECGNWMVSSREQ